MHQLREQCPQTRVVSGESLRPCHAAARPVLFAIPLRQALSVLHGCERIGLAMRHEETKVMSQGIRARHRLPLVLRRFPRLCLCSHIAAIPARAQPGAPGEGRAEWGASGDESGSTLSDEAGLCGRETGLREFAGVGCRVLASSKAASYQLSLQPLRQLHAVQETPPIATVAAQDGLPIGLRTTAGSASELPNQRQVLRVLAGAHAAALNARHKNQPEAATAAVRRNRRRTSDRGESPSRLHRSRTGAGRSLGSAVRY